METLFPKHTGPHLRSRQQRQRTYRRSKRWIDANAGGGRTERRGTAHLCQQTGSTERDERRGDHRQARPALPQEQKLVYPGHVRDQRRRSLRRPGLALQPAEERKSLSLSPLEDQWFINSIMENSCRRLFSIILWSIIFTYNKNNNPNNTKFTFLFCFPAILRYLSI